MNFDLIDSFVKMINVLVCFALIAMVLIKSFHSKSIKLVLVILVLCLFVLLCVSLFIDNEIDGFVILFSLVILFYILLLIKGEQKQKFETTRIENPRHDPSYLLFQAKEEERSRIYANLHDDVGAKLLELIYKAKDDESKSIAKEVLSQIRLAVASTENFQCTVDQLADTLINEAQLRLEVSEIELIVSLNVKNPQKKLLSSLPMTFIRIVREVLSNTIKHAKASQVELVINSDEKEMVLQIIDNGIGFDEHNNEGKGMQTINKRAESISAITSIQSSSAIGTTFELKYDYAH
jgi:signal transduction histidine kinase